MSAARFSDPLVLAASVTVVGGVVVAIINGSVQIICTWMQSRSKKPRPKKSKRERRRKRHRHLPEQARPPPRPPARPSGTARRPA
jgi:hypothetical protein